jgi:tetratricopeptide (TPR) repeat protein
MKLQNNGFEEVKRLPGNIGYLRLNNFMQSYYGGGTAAAAMNFLANTDALIIDLRDNQGGSPTMIRLISSYFFDTPVHLNSFYIRKGDITRQSWTFSHVQGQRLSRTPLYILTGKKTFSAAEEFTYNLKHKAYELALQELAAKSKDRFKKEEIRKDLDARGLQLLEKNHLKEAIKIFQFNVRLFPQSYQVYDSLAEAYLEDNNKELAEVNYKKSLQLNPNNQNAKEKIKKMKN